MSSYRSSYVPWKSNISSYSSKYSSDDKSPRFGSISNTSAYRPSYSLSSGTYRSVGIKKDPPATTTNSYTSKYGTSSTKETEKEPSPSKKIASKYDTTKDSSTTASKYGSSKDLTSKYGSTKELASTKYGSTKELPTGSSKYGLAKELAPASSKYGSTKELTTSSKYGSSKELAAISRYGSNKELTPASSKYSSTKELSPVSSKYGTTKDATKTSTSKDTPSISKYGSLKELNALKPKEPVSSKYGSNRDISSASSTDSKSSRYLGSSTTSSLVPKPKKDDGPPISYNTRYSRTMTSGRSRDPSPAVTTKNIKTRDPSPANIRSQPLSIARSRDPSPVDSKYSSISKARNRDPSPATNVEPQSKIAIIEARIRSRDPSPVTMPISTSSSISSRIRSRDPSPIDTNYSRRSREPSPAESRFTPSYKMYTRSNTGNNPSTYSSPTSKYNGSSSSSIPAKSPAVEKALSYLSASESARSRSASLSRHSTPASSMVSKMPEPKPVEKKKEPVRPVVVNAVEDDDDEDVEYEEIEIEVTDESCDEEEDLGTISVDVITRATSPTQPSTTTSYLRSRRADNAKTIEKTIQRAVRRPKCEDKAVQSDRMDDTTRYSRFANSSARLTMNTYLDSKYPSTYSRYSSSNSASSPRSYSTDSAKTSSKETHILSSSTKSRSPPKLALVNRTVSTSSSDSNKKTLPPVVPKAESPTKSLSSSSSMLTKWTNKDFRKSALNMAAPERSRSSRSIALDTETSTDPPKSTQHTRSERSPSVASESSTTSSSSSNDEDSKLNKTKASSRTSLLASSADELPLDKLNDDSLTSASLQQRNDEAKSFLMRALGPVTQTFKTRSPVEISPDKHWLDSNATSVSESLKLDSEPIRTVDVGHPRNEDHTSIDMKYKLRHIDSGERAWWCNSSEDVSANVSKKEDDGKPKLNSSLSTSSASDVKPEVIRINLHRIESGEKAWWLSGSGSGSNSAGSKTSSPLIKKSPSLSGSDKSKSALWWPTPQNDHNEIEEELEVLSDSTQQLTLPPLGDRASPEGLEDTSKGDNEMLYRSNDPRPKSINLFISRHTNIDDLLGGTCHAPFSPSEPRSKSNDTFEMITPEQVKIHEGSKIMPIQPKPGESRDVVDYSSASMSAIASLQNEKYKVLDDAALQVYKDGDFGAYLDLESSLAEQSEEIEGINASRKNSLVVRTQLSVRVHAIIEKLLTCEGRDLRRALFSLKQIFQEDKDLVHGFVALGGLNCLVRVGSNADQNYQNYILRALGQVMLYVDGMNGVMKHGPTIQWLYSLIASKYRLVVKTALKLLLVFVEYVENNCYLLVNAIHAVDGAEGSLPWSNIMRLLKDYDNADTELLIYATSLINKTLSGLNDQDSFYDESDYLEQQGMEDVIHRYMSKQGADLDLLDQLQLYEAVLKFEDGETDGIRIPDSSIRKTLRLRANGADPTERRKSRRHSTGTAPTTPPPIPPPPQAYIPNLENRNNQDDDDSGSSSSQNSNEFSGVFRDGRDKGSLENAGVTPGLRRRRERVERHKTFMKEQQEVAAGMRSPFTQEETNGHGHIKTGVPPRVLNSNESTINRHHYNKTMNNTTPTTITTTTTIIPTSNNTNNSNNHITHHSNNYSNTNHNNNNNNNNSINTSICNNNIIIANNNNPYAKKYNTHNGSLKTSIPLKTNALTDEADFVNNKTVILKKDVNERLHKPVKVTEINSNLMQNGLTNYKQFENDANRLNNYYNKINNGSLKNKNIINNNNLMEKNHQNGIIPNGYPPNDGPTANERGISVLQNGGCGGKMTNGHSVVTNGNGCVTNSNTVMNVSDALGNGVCQNGGIQNGGTSHNGTVGTEKVDKSAVDSENEDKKLILQLKRDHTVKDLTQKLSNLPMSPMSPQEEKPRNIGDMSGLISKAKEGLAKSKSKVDIARSPSVDQDLKKSLEPKKSENELHWEELIKNMSRPLLLCDLDFTDLSADDEKDVLAPRGLGGSIPPPPPPFGGIIPPPMNCMPPPPTNLMPPPMYNQMKNQTKAQNGGADDPLKKNKKTVKLFWKEVREDMIPVSVGPTIWDELPKSVVDTQKLEHLFESRAKDLMTKKQQELNKSKEIIVLDHKRSNAINIAMTKLPPPRAIKAAILKMDATVVTREGIDKLMNMLPTDEERGKIQEAQMVNPELPLGSAENFLLTLSSISELAARLKLWAFKLDFENIEKEIAEPLMDLKQGLELLKANKTFKCILSTLLSVGIFLNGAPVKGFQVEYLAKVPEVKDTVHKHSLLHHLCHMVMETSPDTSDLYSEIGPITRASKADFGELAHNISYLETECKASWDRLKLISKHDCPPQLKQKMVDFLADCAERIIILDIVHRRVINRFRKFLLWLGIPQHCVAESRPNEFSRIISEFALEYRTTRERVQQQMEKKANHRERNKTRGKMIIDIGKFKTQEDAADVELRALLGSPNVGPGSADTSGTFTWRRRRADNLRTLGANITRDESFTDGDDEILESLVKTATKAVGPRPTPRERKRTRHADRKSLKRSRTREGFTVERSGA